MNNFAALGNKESINSKNSNLRSSSKPLVGSSAITNLALEQMLKQNEINGVQRRQLHSCGKIMYTKDSVWKYEKEYRIVTRNHEDIKLSLIHI